ncbi:hypothetical protein Gorai_005026, partial [Gossypium raimondii]|nr:hypothetical protein [Gossypium raimondii]
TKATANDRDGRVKKERYLASQGYYYYSIKPLYSSIPCRVCGLKRSDLVFTQHGIGSRNERVLKAIVDMKGINKEKKASAVNNRFDPNQSSKRRFRRGPDPIHNKS